MFRRRERMRIAPAIELSPEQRAALEQCARARSLPARVVERARIVLRAASGEQDKAIARDLGMTPKKVSRWRKRYLTLGLAGLEKDAPRAGRKPKISARRIQRVVEMTTRHKPPHATHWGTRTMAATVGISEASVRRIWHTHGLKPHLLQTFKVSRDPKFAEKLADIVGLSLNPPEHALVFSLDEKSQIRPWIARNRACRSNADVAKPGPMTTNGMGRRRCSQPSMLPTAKCSVCAKSGIVIRNGSSSCA